MKSSIKQRIKNFQIKLWCTSSWENKMQLVEHIAQFEEKRDILNPLEITVRNIVDKK